MRSLILIPILSILALSVVYAESLEWQFQYVSNLIDNVPSPHLWFTSDEEGLLEPIQADDVPSDGTEYVVYLHMETWGASGMAFSCTPLEGDVSIIPYVFSYSGESEGSLDVGSEGAREMISGWSDQLYVRTRRDWRLTVRPDGDALERALGGRYSATITVEVQGA